MRRPERSPPPPRSRTGHGLQQPLHPSLKRVRTYPDVKPDYVYWDDPNELVDRLRLLVSSSHAGHSGHVNEINSIVEELREVGIIY